MATGKINKEYVHFSNDPPEGCSVEILENDSKIWHGTIIGPKNTPYANGSFRIEIKFSRNFPYHVPSVKMLTPIFHFNFSIRSGKVCLALFDNEWDRNCHISDLMEAIRDVMIEPSVSDVLEIPLADLYIQNERVYNNIAAQWSIKWANGDGGGFLLDLNDKKIENEVKNIKNFKFAKYDPATYKGKKDKKKGKQNPKITNKLNPNRNNNNDDNKDQSDNDAHNTNDENTDVKDDDNDNKNNEKPNDNDNNKKKDNDNDNKNDTDTKEDTNDDDKNTNPANSNQDTNGKEQKNGKEEKENGKEEKEKENENTDANINVNVNVDANADVNANKDTNEKIDTNADGNDDQSGIVCINFDLILFFFLLFCFFCRMSLCLCSIYISYFWDLILF